LRPVRDPGLEVSDQIRGSEERIMSDRYLKAILTVIALELLWIGAKDAGTPLGAQAQPAPAAAAQPAPAAAASPMPVVIKAIEIDAPTRGALPVFSALPLGVEVSGPVKIEADQPIRVEVERPLPVKSVPYEPARTPGE
jgi:hypothetical protein